MASSDVGTIHLKNGQLVSDSAADLERILQTFDPKCQRALKTGQ